jgi:hypothetical protein
MIRWTAARTINATSQRVFRVGTKFRSSSSSIS